MLQLEETALWLPETLFVWPKERQWQVSIIPALFLWKPTSQIVGVTFASCEQQVLCRTLAGHAVSHRIFLHISTEIHVKGRKGGRYFCCVLRLLLLLFSCVELWKCIWKRLGTFRAKRGATASIEVNILWEVHWYHFYLIHPIIARLHCQSL